MKQTVEMFVAKQHMQTQMRRHERVPVDFRVTLRFEGLRMSDRATDLSEGGLGVETIEPLEPMAQVSMQLEVPHAQRPIELLGRVMWVRGERMGIRFESSDPRLFTTVDRLRQDFDRI